MFLRRLPHLDRPFTMQMITFRLVDSLPPGLWTPRPDGEAADAGTLLDQGLGRAWLRDPRVAGLVQRALLHFHGQRYELIAWVVMPNHVHVLVTPAPRYALADIVHSWRSWTGHEANRLLGRTGAFWQRDYFDSQVRDVDRYRFMLHYIEENPVAAGLCSSREQWPWSSASVWGGTAPVVPEAMWRESR